MKKPGSPLSDCFCLSYYQIPISIRSFSCHCARFCPEISLAVGGSHDSGVSIEYFVLTNDFFTPTQYAKNKEGAIGRTDFQKTCVYSGPKSCLVDEE